MSPFEEKLQASLRRKTAPAYFVERVLARARDLPQSERGKRERFRDFFVTPAFRWAVAAAAVCLVVVVSSIHHRRQEQMRREGEMVQAQVMQALRIASVKLNVARRKVIEINQEAAQGRL
jgi:hypothetical protein